MGLSTSAFLLGLADLAVVLACAGHVGFRLRRHRGLPGLLAAAQIATAALIAVHLLPLALGILDRWTVLVAALIAAGAVHFGAPNVPNSPAERGPPDVRGAGSVGAVAMLALVTACGLAFLREVAGLPVTAVDALNFQLPTVVAWIQDGDPWRLAQYYPDYSNATYPHNGNVLLLAATLPFESTVLARFVAVPFGMLTVVAVVAVARELGAPRAPALLAAAAFAAIPVFAKVTFEGAQTDAPMTASFAAGCLFLLRHHRTGDARDLVMAGLALGLAFGTKWYAVTSVVAVLGIWLVAARPRIRDVAAVSGLVAACSGFWFVRNWVEAGNPVFPQGVPLLFDAPPDPLRERAGFSLLHYLGDGTAWSCCVRPAWDAYLSPAALVLIGSALLAARRRPTRATVALLAGLVLLALYLATPFSAFGPEGRPVLTFAGTRYALPGLLAAAVAAAAAAPGLPLPARIGIGGLLGLGTVAGLRAQYELGPLEIALGLIVVVAGAATVRVLPRRVTAALAAASVVAGALLVHSRIDERRYGETDPVIAAIERAKGAEIALAGVWSTDGISPVLPAFGPRFDNRVRFAGHFEQGMLRAERDADAFARRIAGADLLVVGLAQGDREVGWAQRAGWRPMSRSDRLVLLGAP